jgi:hypothetical protein
MGVTVSLVIVKSTFAVSNDSFSLVSMTLHNEALAGAHDVELSGDIAYVPGKWNSFSIIDISNPKIPSGKTSFLKFSRELFHDIRINTIIDHYQLNIEVFPIRVFKGEGLKK